MRKPAFPGRDSVMTVSTVRHEAVNPDDAAAPAEFRQRLLAGMAAAIRE